MKGKARGFVRFNQRQTILAARRRLKMARSVHAYVRGSTAKFYEWLERSDLETVPRGPERVLARLAAFKSKPRWRLEPISWRKRTNSAFLVAEGTSSL